MEKIIDFKWLVGERMDAQLRHQFKSLIQEYLYNLEARNIKVLKYRVHGGIFTATHPQHVEFELMPAGYIEVTINEPSKVLDYEKDFSEIRRAVITKIKRILGFNVIATPKIKTVITSRRKSKANF